jgi:hypothetical protein
VIHRFFASVILAVSLLVSPTQAAQHTPKTAAVSPGELPQFDNEKTAQRHCPKDTVVWLNTNSGIYHEKGMRWYGRTREGAYVCRAEANAAGDRDTRNGQ